ncbi:uncharacterized protein NECHADRAFT_85445 [Fusarium vanettenii 77-13-4]|uniref:Uncharacterized protein n=1 Tax=Fusarium vanettenii (strain ATCC MYA-4622 / CBS 123669 / FGSC 9596 / NRRL 45880 / 77-13-4) TaxID=660122 RepID=C7ZNN0_FUSV7|nr:uncharacterized protein NECHADRAFT_85445 [Fusarium vanettenii 77-13-4]EEU34017.1 predicted protein [Fusarium vanettenii 77-13-4]
MCLLLRPLLPRRQLPLAPLRPLHPLVVQEKNSTLLYVYIARQRSDCLPAICHLFLGLGDPLLPLLPLPPAPSPNVAPGSLPLAPSQQIVDILYAVAGPRPLGTDPRGELSKRCSGDQRVK